MFIRPLLDYADVIYDQPSNASFFEKIEAVQYNAVLAVTAAIKGSFRKKIVSGVRAAGSLSKKVGKEIVLTL